MYASVLPVPVPASTTRCVPSISAFSMRSAIWSWPGRYSKRSTPAWASIPVDEKNSPTLGMVIRVRSRGVSGFIQLDYTTATICAAKMYCHPYKYVGHSHLGVSPASSGSVHSMPRMRAQSFPMRSQPKSPSEGT